jgi:Cu2+-exporting ATPase
VVVIRTADGTNENTLLRLAAGVERESEHPLAIAILDAAAERDLVPPAAEQFEAVAGHGAVARVDGHNVAIGKARLLDREGIPLGSLAADAAALAGEGRTVVMVAIDGHAAGLFAIADEPRPTARAAVEALKKLNVRPVMLTGDNAATANRIAVAVGIDEVIGDVLPADKAARIADLQKTGRRVAMVGDGVNDAPALALADVGIAIGAGTDVAIETADIVLMRSDPLDVATALAIGRGTLHKMRQNLAWAVGYNTLALPLAAGLLEPIGLTLRPEIAAISMSGSSILVALNAIALKRLHLPGGAADHGAGESATAAR